MEKNSKIDITCAAPRTNLMVLNSGLLRPCCHFKGDFGTTNNDQRHKAHDLSEMLESGVKYHGCQTCWEKESRGISSGREMFNFSWSETRELSTIQFNFSNLCNLKCRMCGSDSSSLWAKDEFILRQDDKIASFRPKEIEMRENAFSSTEHLFEFLENTNFSSIKEIAFLGGEPFLQENMYLTLDYLIRRGLTDISLKFVSNGTIVDSRLKELLPMFKTTRLYLSIEATGVLYRYIRGGKGFGVDTIEKNLKFYKNECGLLLDTNCCIGAYNLFNLGELYEWQIANLPDLRNIHIRFGWAPIVNPAYLGIDVIPLELRNIAYLKSREVFINNGASDLSLESLKSIFELEKEHDPQRLEQFVYFTRKLDKLRGEDITKVIPQYKPLFSQFDVNIL